MPTTRYSTPASAKLCSRSLVSSKSFGSSAMIAWPDDPPRNLAARLGGQWVCTHRPGLAGQLCHHPDQVCWRCIDDFDVWHVFEAQECARPLRPHLRPTRSSAVTALRHLRQVQHAAATPGRKRPIRANRLERTACTPELTGLRTAGFRYCITTSVAFSLSLARCTCSRATSMDGATAEVSDRSRPSSSP